MGAHTRSFSSEQIFKEFAQLERMSVGQAQGARAAVKQESFKKSGSANSLAVSYACAPIVSKMLLICTCTLLSVSQGSPLWYWSVQQQASHTADMTVQNA